MNTNNHEVVTPPASQIGTSSNAKFTGLGALETSGTLEVPSSFRPVTMCAAKETLDRTHRRFTADDHLSQMAITPLLQNKLLPECSGPRLTGDQGLGGPPSRPSDQTSMTFVAVGTATSGARDEAL